jgi:hypothetical protein
MLFSAPGVLPPPKQTQRQSQMQQRKHRQNEALAKEWLDRTLQLLLQEDNPLAALRCACDWLVGAAGAPSNAAADAAAVAAEAAAQLHHCHQIRVDGYLAAVAAASKVFNNSSDNSGSSGGSRKQPDENEDDQLDEEEDGTKQFALQARARFSMYAIQAMEATVPVGTPQLAALYFTHGCSMLQLALTERRRHRRQQPKGKQLNKQQGAVAQLAKQSEAALNASHRIRVVCFGEEHPIALGTEKQLRRAKQVTQ